MVILGIAAQIILGLVFLASSIGKFSSGAQLTDHVLDYRILPPAHARAVAVSLPGLELALAVLCLAGLALPVVAAVLACLLIAFTFAIAVNLLRGRKFDCHCFGATRTTIGKALVARNLLLVALACYLLAWSSRDLAFSSGWLGSSWHALALPNAGVGFSAFGFTVVTLCVLYLLSAPEIDQLVSRPSSD
ncbi:MAG: MauE/DoxX family redox-associated membrane protein [Chloroflexota bacterium]